MPKMYTDSKIYVIYVLPFKKLMLCAWHIVLQHLMTTELEQCLQIGSSLMMVLMWGSYKLHSDRKHNILMRTVGPHEVKLILNSNWFCSILVSQINNVISENLCVQSRESWRQRSALNKSKHFFMDGWVLSMKLIYN